MTGYRTPARWSVGTKPRDLRVGLGADFALGADLECAVTVHVPVVPPRAALFCYPGGGYSRDYFDLSFPGRTGYSMAEALVDEGFLVVRCDHLGVGGSSHPERPERIRPVDLAAANSRVVRELAARIANGTLAQELPAQAGLALIGIAHSMGGGLLTIQQSLFADFDGIAMMGWSAVSMPTSARMSALTGLPPEPRMLAPEPPPPRHPGYARVSRGSVQHYWYHWGDVPPDVIEADDLAAVEFPPCAGSMNEPGIAAAHAASIDVPVHLVAGERDLRLPDSDEPGAYPASPRVEFAVLPRSAHCHNMAGTRAIAWRGIADWAGTVTARGARLTA
ncbi:alpha/beta fold hydrolase [Microbacterium tumbae]